MTDQRVSTAHILSDFRDMIDVLADLLPRLSLTDPLWATCATGLQTMLADPQPATIESVLDSLARAGLTALSAYHVLAQAGLITDDDPHAKGPPIMEPPTST